MLCVSYRCGEMCLFDQVRRLIAGHQIAEIGHGVSRSSLVVQSAK
jgi:hypothetical protein